MITKISYKLHLKLTTKISSKAHLKIITKLQMTNLLIKIYIAQPRERNIIPKQIPGDLQSNFGKRCGFAGVEGLIPVTPDSSDSQQKFEWWVTSAPDPCKQLHLTFRKPKSAYAKI